MALEDLNEDVLKNDMNVLNEEGEGKEDDDPGEVVVEGEGEDEGEDETDKLIKEVQDELKSEEEKEEEKKIAAKATEDADDVSILIGAAVDPNALKEKYPEIFKEFPTLRGIIFRDKGFREVFPTVDDAKEASELAAAYQVLDKDLTSGEGKAFFKALKETKDGAMLKNFAGKMLDSLYVTDQEAWKSAVDPTIKRLLRFIESEGTKKGDKNLVLSTKHISNFLYDTPDVPEVPDKDKPNPEREAVEKEKRELAEQRFIAFRDNTINTATKVADNVVLKLLDPKNALSAFQRKSILRDVKEEIAETLSNDKSHQALMDSLWRRALNSGMTEESSTRIQTAYLGRVKQILPGILSKVKKEALGGSKPRKTDDDGREVRRPVPVNGDRANTKTDLQKSLAAGKRPRGVSDMDILNS